MSTVQDAIGMVRVGELVRVDFDSYNVDQGADVRQQAVSKLVAKDDASITIEASENPYIKTILIRKIHSFELDHTRIFIKAFNRGEIELAVSLSDTVENAKAKIFDSTGVLPDQQKLIFQGRILLDGFTLSYYGLQDNSMVYME